MDRPRRVLDRDGGRRGAPDDHVAAHEPDGDGARAAALARLPVRGRGRPRHGDGRGREFEFQHVSIGNPQCAIRVDDGLESLDLAAIGPPIEHSELFPNRTNVSFFRVDGDGRVRARIFERGVGETLASGTGASGAAVAAVLGGAASPVTVELDGGELEVEVGPDLDVTLTGWAEPVFSGEFSDEFVADAGARVMRPAERLERIPPYLFAQLEQKIADRKAAGVDVISLGIGDPDMPTPPNVVEAMERAVRDPSTHTYPSNRGRPEFREAVVAFYRSRFGVELDPDTQVMPAIGGKECIFNINFAFLDEGDVALAADPGYPPYTGGPLIAGAQPVLMPLVPELGFVPGPVGDPGVRARARAADVRELSEQPDGRDRAGRLLRSGRRVCT